MLPRDEDGRIPPSWGWTSAAWSDGDVVVAGPWSVTGIPSFTAVGSIVASGRT